MIRAVFYILICIFIAGCAKEADFELLKNDKDIDIAWWRAYRNSELNDSLNEYFSNDYELKNKALMSEYLAIENDLIKNYSLNAKLDASISKSLTNGDESKKFGASLGGNYTLDLFGKKLDQKRAKMLEFLTLNDEIQDLKQQNAYKIITMLLNKQYLLKNQSLMSKKMQNLASIYELSKYEESIGKISYTEFLEDKTRLDNAKISLVYNDMEIKKINNSFDDLGFKYDGENIGLNDEEFEFYLDNTTINKSLILNKFQVLAKNKKVQIKNINYLVSQKDMYFDISLNAFLSSSSNEIKSMFSFGVLGGGVGIDFGFLDYENVKNKIKLSKIDYEMAKNEYENYLKTTFNLMKNTADDYNFYKKLININKEILQTSKQDYEKKLLKYNLQMISKKELLSYENAYLDAQISLNKAENELDKARCNVLYTIGF